MFRCIPADSQAHHFQCVRMLDALHLATALFLQEQGQKIRIASYDARLLQGAAALGLEAFNLD
jgi:hypothetical protein